MQSILDSIYSLSGTFFTVVVLVIVYIVAKKVLDRQTKAKPDAKLIRSVVLFGILLIGGIAVILALPMEDSLRGQITGLMGIVISAVLALSSATFIGNGLSGIMLRTINNFKPGDFIKVNEHFGRISERGLFHTELQTENRDLTTLPNLYLVTNPVKVTRSSGTFICGTVSLGYDVNRQLIEKALLEAANKCGLSDPFVRITELGDFSVIYKVFGLLVEVKTIISAESRLNAYLLDELHAAGIEIVSPNFMNQRQVGEAIFIPKKMRKPKKDESADAPENIIFDKADEAESIENRKERLANLDEKIKESNEELKTITDEEKRIELKNRIDRMMDIKQKMLDTIDDKIDEISSKK